MGNPASDAALYPPAWRHCFKLRSEQFGITASNVYPIQVRQMFVMDRAEILEFCSCKLQKFKVIVIIEIERFVQSNADDRLMCYFPADKDCFGWSWKRIACLAMSNTFSMSTPSEITSLIVFILVSKSEDLRRSSMAGTSPR